MKKFVGILIFAVLIQFSCNKQTFQKIVKNEDYELKYQEAKRYYTEEKYSRAMQLLEQLVPYEKGKERGEEVLYMFSMCNYNIKDYILAGYYFKLFTETYPQSVYTEECMFLGAYCYYLDSPKSSLDQTPTEQAILEFEIFLNKFEDGTKIDTTNFFIDELRYKLQEKSYNIAKLYYDIGYFNAASISFTNSLEDYPDSPFREELIFYNLKSLYNYASNSIESKKLERFTKAQKKYKTYFKNYPTGKYIKEANKINEECTNKLKNLKS